MLTLSQAWCPSTLCPFYGRIGSDWCLGLVNVIRPTSHPAVGLTEAACEAFTTPSWEELGQVGSKALPLTSPHEGSLLPRPQHLQPLTWAQPPSLAGTSRLGFLAAALLSKFSYKFVTT